MLIDYRYHIFTLVAIFLALGLGVLVGGALFSDDALVKSQIELVNRLEQDFASLRTENRKLTQSINLMRLDLGQERQFLEWIVPHAISGKLQDRNFALIQQGPVEAALLAGISKLLEDSGGKVVAQLRTDPVRWSQVSPDDFQLFAGVLAVGLRGPSLSGLEQRGLLEFSGGNPVGAEHILLLGKADNNLWFKEKLDQLGLKVYTAPETLSSLREKATFILKLSGAVTDERDYRNNSSFQ